MKTSGKTTQHKRARLDGRPLFSLLMSRYGDLMYQSIAAQQSGAVFKLRSPDIEVWVAMNSLIQLSVHVAKLDQCVYYLRSAGKVGHYRRARQDFTEADWQEYHLGYFYALHRSVYEAALWFINQSLQLGVSPRMGFASKMLPKIVAIPSLRDPIQALHRQSEKAAAHRNDHIHRGASIKAEPLTALGFIDEFRSYFSADQLIHRYHPSKFPAEARKLIKRQFKIGRRALVHALDREIEETQKHLCKIADAIEPTYRKLLTEASETKSPTG